MQLMIGDVEFRAIGHVAAQWAYFETQLDAILHILLAQPSVKPLQLRVHQSFQRRMETLKKAANVVLAKYPEELKPLLAIIADASSLRGKRDDIVHGHWKLYREKGRGPLTTGVRVVHMRGPSIKVHETAFSATTAEAIAAKISKANLRLIGWSMRNIP